MRQHLDLYDIPDRAHLAAEQAALWSREQPGKGGEGRGEGRVEGQGKARQGVGASGQQDGASSRLKSREEAADSK